MNAASCRSSDAGFRIDWRACALLALALTACARKETTVTELRMPIERAPAYATVETRYVVSKGDRDQAMQRALEQMERVNVVSAGEFTYTAKGGKGSVKVRAELFVDEPAAMAKAPGLAEFGTPRMVIAKSKLGLQTGDTILGVHATTWPGAASANVTTEEAGYFDYKLRGNDFCALGGTIPPPPTLPGPPPVVSPDNNRMFGGALPLATLLVLSGLALARVRRARRG